MLAFLNRRNARMRIGTSNFARMALAIFLRPLTPSENEGKIFASKSVKYLRNIIEKIENERLYLKFKQGKAVACYKF
jgi:hypothetical protein